MKFKFPNISARNQSLILSIAAGVGVVVTSYISARCAKKIDDEAPVKDKVVSYLPAIVSGGVTIGAIALSTKISSEEITGLMVSLTALGTKFADYKKSVVENVDAETNERINNSFYEREIVRLNDEVKRLSDTQHPEEDDDELCTFVDSAFGYSFKGYLDEVFAGISDALGGYEECGYLSWPDIFYFLNNKDEAPSLSDVGVEFGWSKDMIKEYCEEDVPLTIDLTEVTDMPNTYLITYSISPEWGFSEY